MLTTNFRFPDDRRTDEILSSLLVAGLRRIAIKAALSVLAELHGKFREQGNSSSAQTMANATGFLLKDQAEVEAIVAELEATGGTHVVGWEELSRDDVRERLKKPETERDLKLLSGRYLMLAVRSANLEQLERAAAMIGVTVPEEPSDAG